MEKTIYMIIGILLGSLVFVFYTAGHLQTNNLNNAMEEDYAAIIERTLGSTPSEDVHNLLITPPTLTYKNENWFFDPMDKTRYYVTFKKTAKAVPGKLDVYLDIEEDLTYEFSFYVLYQGNWVQPETEGVVLSEIDEWVMSTTLVPDGDEAERNREFFEQANILAEKFAVDAKLEIEFSMTVDEAVKAAGELDAFYQKHNRWIELQLIADEDKPFKGREFHDAAIGLGLKWGDYDEYHWEKDSALAGDEYLFSLYNLSDDYSFYPEEMAKEDYTTPGVGFYFYLPGSPDPAAIFQNMITAVKYLQTRLGGQITGIDGTVLDDAALEEMALEIEAAAKEMTDKGFKPGDEEAHTLFYW